MKLPSFFSLPGFKARNPKLIFNKFLNSSPVAQKYLESQSLLLSKNEFEVVIKSIDFINERIKKANSLSTMFDFFTDSEIPIFLRVFKGLGLEMNNKSFASSDINAYVYPDFFEIYNRYPNTPFSQRDENLIQDLRTSAQYLSKPNIPIKDKAAYIDFISSCPKPNCQTLYGLWIGLVNNAPSNQSGIFAAIMLYTNFKKFLPEMSGDMIKTFISSNPEAFTNFIAADYEPPKILHPAHTPQDKALAISTNQLLNSIVSYSFETNKDYLKTLSNKAPFIHKLLLDYFFGIRSSPSIDVPYNSPLLWGKSPDRIEKRAFIESNNFFSEKLINLEKINFSIYLFEQCFVPNIFEDKNDSEFYTQATQGLIRYMIAQIITDYIKSRQSSTSILINSEIKEFNIKSANFSQKKIVTTLILDLLEGANDYTYALPYISLNIISSALGLLPLNQLSIIEEQLKNRAVRSSIKVPVQILIDKIYISNSIDLIAKCGVTPNHCTPSTLANKISNKGPNKV